MHGTDNVKIVYLFMTSCIEHLKIKGFNTDHDSKLINLKFQYSPYKCF
jgi:hypothetical protein